MHFSSFPFFTPRSIYIYEYERQETINAKKLISTTEIEIAMQKQEVKEEERNSDKKEEKNERQGNEGTEESNQTPLMALNHISRLCRDVKESIDFYTKVLGFVLIERPHVLDFEGAWLFNYGVGIHLVQSKEEQKLPSADAQHDLDPQDNHISFQVNTVQVNTRSHIYKRLLLF